MPTGLSHANGEKGASSPHTACVASGQPDPAAPVSAVLLPAPLPCSETLPVEYLGGKPLCMNQYYQILSSCRVPGPKQDSVTNFSKIKKPPAHITVVHNYQVGAHLPGLSPPRCCREGGVGQESASPTRLPGHPKNRQARGLSTRCLARPQPGAQEGLWAWPGWEEQCKDLPALLTLGQRPSPRLGRQGGVGGDCCPSEPPTSPLLSPCLCLASFLSWTCTTVMGHP